MIRTFQILVTEISRFVRLDVRKISFSKNPKNRNKLSDKEEQLRQSSESQFDSSDKLSSRLRELTSKLEHQQQVVNDARSDRDRQAELR